MISLNSQTINSIWDRFSLEFPSSQIFVGELLFHEVEAKVEMEIDEPIDELERLVLRAVQLSDPAIVEEIDSLLHLGRQIVYRLCQSFCKRGLLVEEDQAFRITQEGERTLETGREPRMETSFRKFYFIHPIYQFVSPQVIHPDLFRDIPKHESVASWKFVTRVLDTAIAQTDSWKQENGFPREIRRRIVIDANSEPAPDPSSSVEKVPVTDVAKSMPVIGVVPESGGHIDLYSLRNTREINSPVVKILDEHAVSGMLAFFLPEPNQSEIDEAWRSFCYDRMLERPDDASVSFCNGELLVSLDFEHVKRLRVFIRKEIKRSSTWHVGCGNTWRLCKLQFSGVDQEANTHLQTLSFLVKLSIFEEKERLLKSKAELLDWCQQHLIEQVDSVRALSNVAFENGDFELALAIGELEDMVDAAV